jgi:hypothetical protein
MEYPTFKQCAKMYDLDVLVAASGFTKQDEKEFEEVCPSSNEMCVEYFCS